jgi:prevent-host-death family protein
MTTMTLVEARQAIGDAVDRVRHRGTPIVLTKNGKAAAALVPMELLELLRKLEDADDLRAARKALREARAKGTIPLAQVLKDAGL